MPSNTGYAQIKYDVREPKPSLPAQQYHPDGSAEKYGMIQTNLKVIKSESPGMDVLVRVVYYFAREQNMPLSVIKLE